VAPEVGPIEVAVAGLRRRAGIREEDFFIVGAAARDLIIVAATGEPPARATEDVDIAIGISSWSAYGELVNGLDAVGASKHKFLVSGIEVDIVPFGGVEHADRTITWPDEMSMNLLGFREAFDAAEVVRIGDGSTVKVAPLTAQFFLKLMAWSDRKHITTKDAVDLRSILDASAQSPFVDSLYDENLSVFEAHGFDPLDAAAHRLARDAVLLLKPTDRYVIAAALELEASETGTMPAYMGGTVSRNRELLRACQEGVSDAIDAGSHG
jgi:predicted nucleotidyltransferase